MIRRTLALLNRSLRVDVRDVKGWLFRAVLAAMLVWWLAEAQLDQTRWGFSAPGLRFFRLVTLSNFWFITAAAASFFATAITEEKEEQTLGLLKLAGVNTLSLLLGKWLPRLIGAALLVSIQYPFTLLAITLGGVTSDQVVAAYVALLAHLVLVGNLGLLASVVTRRSSNACGLTVIVLFALLIGPWLVAGAADLMRGSQQISSGTHAAVMTVCDWFRTANAFVRINTIMATGFVGTTLDYQFNTNVIAAAALFGLSWMLCEPFTRNDSAPGPAWKWLARLPFRRTRRPSRRAGKLPLAWKEFHFVAGGWGSFAGKLLLYPVAAVMILQLFSGDSLGNLKADEYGDILIWLCLIVSLIELAFLFARILRNEIVDQTWSTLSMLPRLVPEIVYPKVGGVLLTTIPAVWWIFVGVLLAPEDVADFFDHVVRDESALMGFAYAISLYVTFVHLTVLLSIIARWGSWPLAMFLAGFAMFVVHSMFWGCIGVLGPGGTRQAEATILFLLAFFGFALSLGLHVLVMAYMGETRAG